MKNKLGVPKGRALADFLPTITIKAKDFATEITVFNTKEKGLKIERQIAEEDIKKLERRVSSEPKKLGKNPDKLEQKKHYT